MAERNRQYCSAMALQNVLALTGLCVPQSGGLVVAGGGDEAAIRADGHGRDVIGMPLQNRGRFARGQIPEPRGVISTRAGQCLCIGRESDSAHPAVVAFEGVFFLRRGGRDRHEQTRDDDKSLEHGHDYRMRKRWVKRGRLVRDRTPRYAGCMSARLPSAFVALLVVSPCSAADKPPSPEQVLDGVRTFFKRTAKPDGSFRPGIDPEYEGMSDSAYSDLAPVAYSVVIHKTFGWPLPNEQATKRFLHSRQQPDGAFVNMTGTVDPKSAAGRAYNTTMAVMALRALGTKPKYDPLPVFAVVLKADYKSLPLYMTSFFPLAYLASGKEIPPEADDKIRALMAQDADGYLNEHIAATFHAAHYYRLTGEKRRRPMPW